VVTDKNKSAQFLSSDLLESILELSSDPGECSKFITSEIRELIGVKIVALMQAPLLAENDKYSIVSVCPARHRKTLNCKEINELCTLSENNNSVVTIEADNEYLVKLGLNKSIIIPLKAGDEHVGALLLLDLLSTDGIKSVLDSLHHISGVIGLIFKNSLLFRNLDHLVEQRTQKLEQEIQTRQKAEIEIYKLQNYLTNIIDSMPSIIIGVDENTNIVLWNKTAEIYSGIPSDNAIGKLCTLFFPRIKLDGEKIRKSIISGEINREQKVVLGNNKLVEYKDITIFPLNIKEIKGAVIRIDDVTEKVRMDETLIQNDKMLSVGGLAAGMAHEINNPLAGIIQTSGVLANRLYQNLDMKANREAALRAGLSLDSLKEYMEARDIPKMISSMYESGHRISDIVENMLGFARKSNRENSSHSINEILEKTLMLASTDFNLKKQYDFKNINVVRNYDRELAPVPCDKAKIQQVLLNILQNGAQAMYNAQIPDPKFIIETFNKADKNMICISIEDNGPGMPEDVRTRIFEPFFTTKQVGIGTGLGLSISYFIITENHNGKLTVESPPGKGAKFILELPLLSTSNPENNG